MLMSGGGQLICRPGPFDSRCYRVLDEGEGSPRTANKASTD
jgi:hypothetical protein